MGRKKVPELARGRYSIHHGHAEADLRGSLEPGPRPLTLDVQGEADLARLPIPAGWKAEGRARVNGHLRTAFAELSHKVGRSRALEEALHEIEALEKSYG